MIEEIADLLSPFVNLVLQYWWQLIGIAFIGGIVILWKVIV